MIPAVTTTKKIRKPLLISRTLERTDTISLHATVLAACSVGPPIHLGPGPAALLTIECIQQRQNLNHVQNLFQEVEGQWGWTELVIVTCSSHWSQLQLTFSEAWYGPQTQIFGKMKNTCGEIHLESPKNLAWPNLNKPPNLNLWNKKSWYILSDRRTDILNILNWSWDYCNVISTCKLQAVSVIACDVKI